MLNRTMTEGTPWKHILRFSLPVLAGSLLQQLYNTVDAIIVGKYASEAALSAVGTTGSFARGCCGAALRSGRPEEGS